MPTVLGVNASPLADLIHAEEVSGDMMDNKEASNETERKFSLQALYHRVLLRLGVNRNIKFGWRHLPSTFGGIGLRRLLPEILIAQINLCVQHYGADSNIGRCLSISLECLQLEAGTVGHPPVHPFHPLGPLTTKC